MKSTKEHLANFCIAGATYYQLSECFEKLNLGRKVNLVLEEDNKYDARAVAIYYKDYKLGFVPRAENRIIYKLLKVGLVENLVCRIQQIDASEHPESQIRVVVHLKA